MNCFAYPILCYVMSEENKYAWFYSYIKSKKKKSKTKTDAWKQVSNQCLSEEEKVGGPEK